ncbi:hypothetical protein BDW72DRAFT_183126 [Aspergillus terricola var. indicus]
MAGIATRFKKRGETNDYLAGAWRETLIEDLLWEVSSPKDCHGQRVNSDIPSWTWARSDVTKTYIERAIIVPLCNLEAAGCTLSPFLITF